MKKMNRKFWILGAAVAVVAVLSLAFSSPGKVEGGKPVVRIGLSAQMTGNMAFVGEETKNAAELFMENFDAESAYYRYEIIIEDNRSRVADTVSVVNKMISSDKVNAVLSFSSGHGLAVSPIAERSRVIHMSASTDPAVAIGDFNFTLTTSPAQLVELILDHIESVGAKNISVVMTNIAVGEVYLRGLSEAVAKRPGLRMAEPHRVNTGDTDFRTIIQKIRAERPDVIMNLLFVPEVDVFLRQYRQARMAIPMVGIEIPASIKHKELAEGLVFSDNAPATDEFAREYTLRFGGRSPIYAQFVYSMLEVLTSAFEAYAKPEINNAEVAAMMLKTADGMETAVGRITSRPSGVLDTSAVLRVIKNGKAVIKK
ncbi:MAG: ABC transporter substrate-binding protein [Alphaproteobacteria bacterium]|nr:ABC transporter substrate-binding protein [Alphaproteobacteria bacterium]